MAQPPTDGQRNRNLGTVTAIVIGVGALIGIALDNVVVGVAVGVVLGIALSLVLASRRR